MIYKNSSTYLYDRKIENKMPVKDFEVVGFLVTERYYQPNNSSINILQD